MGRGAYNILSQGTPGFVDLANSVGELPAKIMLVQNEFGEAKDFVAGRE